MWITVVVSVWLDCIFSNFYLDSSVVVADVIRDV